MRILCWIAGLLFFSSFVVSTNKPQIVDALQSFYNATNGEHWNWKPVVPNLFVEWTFVDPTDYCLWQGICCFDLVASLSCHELQKFVEFANKHDNENGTYKPLPSKLGDIIGINLMMYALNGTLPSQLFYISTIQYLLLDGNRLRGQISPEISNLKKLQWLGLSSCNHTGIIPNELFQLTQLIFMDLMFNSLNGTVPTSIGRLTNLINLGLGSNYFSGRIPSSIGDLTKLQFLNLIYNGMTGTLPTALGNMSSIKYIYLSYNLFSGSIPIEWTNFPHMLYYGVDSNILTGPVPDLSNMTNCSALYLNTNLFTGSLPTFLGELTSLWEIYLEDNLLIGSIPLNLLDLTRLQALYLEANYLTGTLPVKMWQMQGLQEGLYLGHNQFTGTIPTDIHMPQLGALSLANNYFHGTIPASFQTLSLSILLLSGNYFSGQLVNVASPSQTRLLTVDLSTNIFTGTLPYDLFNLPQINHIMIAEGCFEGALPASVCNATSLRVLALDGLTTAPHCRLTLPFGNYMPKVYMTGTIPACLFTLPNLVVIQLSGNGFYGTLPVTNISASLRNLSLSNNRLSGTIPLAFQRRQHGSFQLLDLSYNRLSGEISMMKFFDQNKLSATDSVMVNTSSSHNISHYHHLPQHNISHAHHNISSIQVQSNFTYINDIANKHVQLILQVNQLSGLLPANFYDPTNNITVVGGNLFTCSVAQRELPLQDPGTYYTGCGSSYLYASFIFTGVIFAICAILITATHFAHHIMPTVEDDLTITNTRTISVDVTRKSKAAVADLSRMTTYVMKCISCSDEVSKWNEGVSFTDQSVLQGMPLTISFIQFIKTMQHLSLSVVVLLIPFLAIQLLFKFVDHGAYSTHLYQYGFTPSLAYIRGYAPAAVTLVLVIVLGTTLHCVIKVSYGRYSRFRLPTWSPINTPQVHQKRIICVAISLLNFSLMILANGIYLVFVLGSQYTETYVGIVLELSLGFVKLMWNVFGLPYTLHVLKGWLMTDEPTSTMPTLVLSSLMIFNNTFIPIMLTMALDVNCFNTTSLEPSEFTYTYNMCSGLFADQCVIKVPQVGHISYQPPFIYSYQCSSAILQFYTPVFIAMYSFNILLSPIMVWLIPHMFSYLQDKKYHVWITAMLKFVQTPITQTKGQHLQDLRDSRQRVILYTDVVAASLISNFAVLLTFGVAYPPLGLIVAASSSVEVLQQRYLIGRYLLKCTNMDSFEAKKLLRKKLEHACTGQIFVLDKFKMALMMTLTLFYSIFLLDMTGNNEDVCWGRMMVIPVLLLLWPIALACVNLVHIFGTNLFQPAARLSRAISLVTWRRSDRALALVALNKHGLSHKPEDATQVYHVNYNSSFE